jgi:hypothetical protein
LRRGTRKNQEQQKLQFVNADASNSDNTILYEELTCSRTVGRGNDVASTSGRGDV